MRETVSAAVRWFGMAYNTRRAGWVASVARPPSYAALVFPAAMSARRPTWRGSGAGGRGLPSASAVAAATNHCLRSLTAMGTYSRSTGVRVAVRASLTWSMVAVGAV